MSDRFSFRRGFSEGDPWFRVGSVDVGTTMLLTGVSVVSFLLYAVSPAIVELLFLWPRDVLRGFLWQVVTWPVANAPGFWSAITIFLFWYFGTELEGRIGKSKFLSLLVMTTVAMSVIAIVLSLAFSSTGPVLAGLESLQLVVVLLFILQNPHARFFFGIPGWVIGLAIVVLPVLAYVGNRQWIGLLNLLIGLAAAAVIARGHGLLNEYAFIPAVGTPRRSGRSREKQSRRGRQRSARRHPSAQTPGPTVVEGPWLSSGAAGSPQAELDDLLDKISAGGIDSLSSKERKRLQELRNLLRGE